MDTVHLKAFAEGDFLALLGAFPLNVNLARGNKVTWIYK